MNKEDYLEFDEKKAFNPYCYNCAEYDTQTQNCNLKNDKVKPRSTCSSFNQRSNYSEEEIDRFTKDQRDKEKKAEKNKKKKFDFNGSNIMIENYQENVEKFYETNPFFYDKANIFWLWDDNKKKYDMVDDTDIMILLDDVLGFKGFTVNSKIKSQYLEAFKRVGRKNIPEDAPTKWIQFKDKAFSLKSKNTYDVTHHFFFTNPIPFEIGETSDTPIMDKLIKEWVGEEYVQTAYEIIAYCCLSDYPIHLIFCLVGCGRNGKSKFLGLINKFMGKENICSTELDLLTGNSISRFESFKLYKKLVCLMGETNFGTVNRTSLLKKLVGQDLIGYEVKNKLPFDGYNYAKVLIASNSLPPTEDTSEGFYRRWLILDFPNTFPEGHDILKDIPEEEYNHLAKKVTEILPGLLERGSFNNQGTIEDRKNKYIMVSNPLPMYISQYCYRNPDFYIRYSEFYTTYIKYLNENKRRIISKKEFSTILGTEGLEIQRTTKDGQSDRWVLGLSLKEKNDSNVSNDSLLHKNSIGGIKGEQGHLGQMGHSRVLTCVCCGDSHCIAENNKGEPLCETCYGSLMLNKTEEVR
jgi:P4 family phage/plasmid primase-like protien